MPDAWRASAVAELHASQPGIRPLLAMRPRDEGTVGSHLQGRAKKTLRVGAAAGETT